MYRLCIENVKKERLITFKSSKIAPFRLLPVISLYILKGLMCVCVSYNNVQQSDLGKCRVNV